MARPKKQPHEKRSARIPTFDVTEAERSYVDNQAIVMGMSLAEFCRQSVLTGQVKESGHKPLYSLLAELNRVGNNVNQIARQLNRGREHDPHHLNHVLHELMQLVDRIGRKI